MSLILLFQSDPFDNPLIIEPVTVYGLKLLSHEVFPQAPFPPIRQ